MASTDLSRSRKSRRCGQSADSTSTFAALQLKPALLVICVATFSAWKRSSAAVNGPGTTTIELRGSDTLFGPALEAALREWGYAVVIDEAIEGTAVTPLAYSIDPFEGGVLVRLSTLQVELTRMYTLNAEGATPASPLSVMQRGSEVAP